MEPMLSTCPLRFRTAEAHTSHFDANAKHCCTFHCSLQFRFSLSLSSRCLAFDVFVLSHSCQQGSAVSCHSCSFSIFRVDHGTFHVVRTATHTTPVPLHPPQLLSFNIPSAADRVTCFFQAHKLSRNSLCMKVHEV